MLSLSDGAATGFSVHPFRIAAMGLDSFTLDAFTLLIVTAFVSALVGTLLGLAWLRNRRSEALLWWAASFGMAALGTMLLLLHGNVHQLISIDLGHMLVVLSCGFILSGARVFNGRHPNIAVSIAGAMLWVLVIVAIGENFTFADRILMTGLVTGVYFGLCGWELWRGSGETNLSQSTAGIFLIVHAVLVLFRVPFPVLDTHHEYGDALGAPGFTFMTFEALVYSVGLAFLLLAMTLEHGENKLKMLALEDSLTGISNRRAFDITANKIMARDARSGRPTALLAFDLDHFKRVNDTYGHDFGDEVLKVFARATESALRSSDVFGRVGGEEFAAILPETDEEEAAKIADRARAMFADAGRIVHGRELNVTASIGVAITGTGEPSLDKLKKQADIALYRAKATGRNLVLVFSPEQRAEKAMPPVSLARSR